MNNTDWSRNSTVRGVVHSRTTTVFVGSVLLEFSRGRTKKRLFKMMVPNERRRTNLFVVADSYWSLRPDEVHSFSLRIEVYCSSPWWESAELFVWSRSTRSTRSNSSDLNRAMIEMNDFEHRYQPEAHWSDRTACNLEEPWNWRSASSVDRYFLRRHCRPDEEIDLDTGISSRGARSCRCKWRRFPSGS